MSAVMGIYSRSGYVLSILLFILSFEMCYSLKNLTLGLFVPMTGWAVGHRLASAAPIAIDAINNDPTLLPGYKLNFVWRDCGCSSKISAGGTVEFLKGNVSAIIGPYCSKGCETSGHIAAYYKLPMLTYSCSKKQLSDKAIYPTVARTLSYARTDEKILLNNTAQLMKIFKWSIFAIVVEIDEVWQTISEYFQKYSSSFELTVNKYLYVPEKVQADTVEGEKHREEVLRKAAKRSRIIMFLGYYSKIRKMILTAKRIGLFDGTYAFITVDFLVEDSWQGQPFMNNKTLAIFDSFLDLSSEKPDVNSTKYQQFRMEVRRRMSEEPFFLNMSASEKVEPASAYLHDTIFVYAIAYNKTLQKGGDPTDTAQLMQNIFGSSYSKGYSGDVVLDSKGDRVPVVQLRNFRDGESYLVHQFTTTSRLTLPLDIRWPNGAGPPLDQPKCGFDNENCPKKGNSDYILAGGLLGGLVLLGGFLFYMWYKKKKFERDLLCDGFFVNYDEVINNSIYHGKSGSMFASRFPDKTSRTLENIDEKSLNETYSVPSETESMLEKSQFVARYQGHQVVTKKLNKTTVHLSREMLLEFKMVRDLRQVNINPILGVCVQYPDICILTQYCQKSSLQDILQNDDIKLDDMFKLSLASDIAMGMLELHRSPIGAHGRLTSCNCVIDNRWVCKITDYGLDKLKANAKEDISEYQQYRKLLWTAPELLSRSERKTKAGDVYSYGIILAEIMTREDPYAEAQMEPKDIVHLVSENQNPLFRPKLTNVECDVRYTKLMQLCWEENALQRPTFEVTKSKLRQMHGGRQGNLVDNMVGMLEKYANNLEDLVEERTQQLAAEKLKTDELLYKMLPKTIAEQLKQGHVVTAECFDSVTIFFSDIVGFTGLASQSTPMQVVDLLNDLYTCFDRVLDTHEVYKVETIGDAYMVVSGLPRKNGIRHAGEIATMSLDLLHCIKSFRIRHHPEKSLQLRAGIHSGSCVAGVVGLKMPRYCLFGDTVNYASRMESSGLALRVHVSPECKNLLDQLGGYDLMERGPVTMKGKGTVVTYFLDGKDGYTKSLPDLRLAASLEEHTFK